MKCFLTVALLIGAATLGCREGRKDQDSDDGGTPPPAGGGASPETAVSFTSPSPFAIVDRQAAGEVAFAVDASVASVELTVGANAPLTLAPPFIWAPLPNELPWGVTLLTAVAKRTGGEVIATLEQEVLIIDGAPKKVPESYPSIQAAIDAAAQGEAVIVAPGTYLENLIIRDKRIVLASTYFTSGRDETLIDLTVVDGQFSEASPNGDPNEGTPDVNENDTLTVVGAEQALILGMTIQKGNGGITTLAPIEVDHCLIRWNGDGLSFESAKGKVLGSRFLENVDDGIDVDGSSEVEVVQNVVADNGDDGLEMRLHDHSGSPILNVIRDNQFLRNGEDGVQLIDHQTSTTARKIRIEHNLIAENTDAGIGLMGGGNSVENFEGAPISEEILVLNNVIAKNNYGLSGGAALAAFNNVFLENSGYGLKGLSGESKAAHNLFWGNGTVHDATLVDGASTVVQDPALEHATYRKTDASPIGFLTSTFTFRGAVFDGLAKDFVGPRG